MLGMETRISGHPVLLYPENIQDTLAIASFCDILMRMAGNKKNGKKQKIVKVKINFSWKNVLLYGFILLFTLLLFASATQPLEQVKTVPLSQVIADVKGGRV